MIVYDKEQKEIVIPNGIGNINLFNNGVEAGYNQGKIDGIDEQKSKLESINITENGTYTKEDGYNHIEVNVPDLNGSYDEGYEQGHTEGYNEGYTEGEGVGYNQGKTDGVNEQKDKLESINITENGTYAKEDGYNKVVVNVPDLNGDYNEGYAQGKTDGVNEQKSKLESISITENGTYDREDGYNHIEVNVANAVQITYAELKSLRDAGNLVPGTQYHITDYTCTTTQANTKSAGHQFDIIVTADDESTLNEEARAALHTGDEYFSGCNLNAWKIWYCLDNDTTRFAWADATNGKGVIYRMIDEFNNDVPYDFKNIQFYRKWDSGKSLWSTISSDNTGVPCYTFSSTGNSATTLFTDMSLLASNDIYSNVIKKYVNDKKQTLSNICFFGNNCYSNTFGNNCNSNSFGNDCNRNTFGNECNSNTFGNSCYNNTFGNGCGSNTFGNSFQANTFGNECNSNTFGNYCFRNTFGNYCSNNTFGNSFQANTFRNNCGGNTFGNDFQYNTFGNYCSRNTFENYCYSNTFGNDCSSNTFGHSCWNSTFGNNCGDNTFGNGFQYNTFGNRCSRNTFGNYFQESQFGDGVQYFSITTQQMTTNPTSSYLKNYIRWLIVENGVSYVNAYVTGTTSDTSYCQNVRICLGVQGVDSNNRKTFDITSCINSKLNNVYQPANSQTTSV